MLTEQRHKIILNELEKNGIVKVNDLVDILNTSESTIRRDLTCLEKMNAVRRIRGGAAVPRGRLIEQSYGEKEVQNVVQKRKIAEFAASCVDDGDCIYIDAGTSTFEMIRYLKGREIVIVTNGLKHINAVTENNINGYILGGSIKNRTGAVIGADALGNLQKFRFDKCFMGMNGIHLEYGFTTPDSEEAALKTCVIKHSRQSYVLADESKFGEVSFVKVADLKEADIITDCRVENYKEYAEKTRVKVVMDK
ncbi:MAG: DeoR/GlpR family DNA-binding transcription regulator [Clostridium sp.]|uniref:DeoR/GlpR family DNA-binding transcription regulator n=1 Tax=Clostridium sp. TaxID=1506 RepID=UPI0025B9BE33|nr:DeoR/GlpR family DNA-binding transcription regulator [Clostridium sp.]MCH3965017.1 DeoR/GlpR family DNA-binding transcription regulator [Clostridium sp.]MCI1714238.1 DeoR/GlpR family DNA-binding transcription regulator [Clostridium sp.]MCI1798500.1 DeoR/GlpR family DNA-binding transcription regulator [Clostridium sp.]MCI1869309.1 DeoR/GlpR family DNA-binding transcription regulator [Clostridium sp.]MCI2201458.1 DeoR/GlpR family DNA-binding transcription regulator [Clostridium sp.]